jgi:hypothetical protein
VQRPGAAQKLLRGAFLGPAFRHRLHGFSFWEDGVPRAGIDTPPLSSTGGSGQPLVRVNDDAITGRYKFKPVASRDSLFVVRRFSRGVQTMQRSDAVAVVRPRDGKSTAVSMASEDPHLLPQLTFDLQLKIVERSDAVTVVRCAATHKRLRGAILGPAFRRRLGVDPALLLGFSFWGCKGRCAIDTPPLVRLEDDRITEFSPGGQPLVRLDDRITEFHPVESRDGLVVVLRSRPTSPYTMSYDLRVCNAFTGDVTASLPPTSTPGHNKFVLLNTAGRSFELLAVGTGMHTQILSSDRWEWGPVRDTSFPGHQHPTDLSNISWSLAPTVIGRTVYWLCSKMLPFPTGPAPPIARIVSLEVDAAEGNMREVPSYCFSEMVYRNTGHFKTSALLTSVRGGLCVFVLERNAISAWAPEQESPTWSRQFMLTRTELEARSALYPHEFILLRLHAYGERSGTVILGMTPCVFLWLNIREGFKVARLVRLGSQDTSFGEIKSLCLHEIHLVSLLRSMKSFPQGAQGTFSSSFFSPSGQTRSFSTFFT